MNKTKIALSLGLLAGASLPAMAATVLVISSYHADYPWDSSYMEGLRSVLGEQHRILRVEMDTKRLPKSEYQRKADEAWARFESEKPDLVVLADDNALSFLGRKIDATGTSSVFLGINSHPREAGIDKMRHMTGVLERPLFKRSVLEIRRIMRNKLAKVLILFDSGNTSTTAVAEAFAGRMSDQIGEVQADIKLVATKAEWHETVLGAKDAGYDAIIVGLYQTLVDEQGIHQNPEEILAWTANNTPVPDFAFWDFSIGKDKAIGGLVLFGRSQGEEAGKMAQRILAGTPPKTISPVIGEKGRYLFSKSGMAKWRLELPDNLRERSAWTD